MDDLFSKVVIINLKGQDERLQQAAEQLRKTGTHKFERLDAVDGRELTAAERKTKCTAYCRAMCTPSMIGCFLSHRKAWQKCVDEGLPSILVLEDDVLFTDDAAAGARAAMREMPPSFDVALLGCFTCDQKETTLEDASIARMLYPHRKPTQVSEHLWAPAMIFGMHAYAVSQAGARKMLRLMPRASNHVDWELSRHLDVLHAYALKPGVAYQTGMDSSNMGSRAPIFVNALLSRVRIGTHKDDGRTLAWLCSEAWGRFVYDKIIINKYFVGLMLCACMGWWRPALGAVALDLLLALLFLRFAKSMSVVFGYSSLCVGVAVGAGIRAAIVHARF